MAQEELNTSARYHWDRKTRGESVRPWRLFGTPPGAASDPKARGRNLRWRAFGDEVRAHNAAMIDVRWGEFRTIEVYNAVTGLESGTYLMRASGDISFSAPDTSNIIKLLRKKGLVE